MDSNTGLQMAGLVTKRQCWAMAGGISLWIAVIVYGWRYCATDSGTRLWKAVLSYGQLYMDGLIPLREKAAVSLSL